MAQETRQSDLDFAADLFRAADKMRQGIELVEYKHVALGFIFLKCISEAFCAHREKFSPQKTCRKSQKLKNKM